MKSLQRLVIFTLLLAAGSLAFARSTITSPNKEETASAADLLHSALAAMGGEAKIRALKTVQFKAIGHKNFLEQSERPEGPYIVGYNKISESRDLEHGRWKQASEMDVATQPKLVSSVTVDGGVAARQFSGREAPGSGQEVQDSEEALELSPERVLLTGLAARDLRREGDTVVQAVPHHVVVFTWRNVPVRLFLNAETGLPTAVEWVRAYPYGVFWSIWGDVTTRVYYSFWWLAKGGVHYPLQSDTFRNGLPDRTVTITEIDLNVSLAEDLFSIPEASKKAFAARATRTADDWPFPGQSGQEIVNGVVFIPGVWNTSLVRQSDGIVVIEAPISSGYSVRAIAEANKRFPGVPIKAVITTSDAWPHIGGVREYVAQGIPVYVLDRTRPLIERMVAAPRSSVPDRLAQNPRKPDFRSVSGKIAIGDGPNKLEIYPIRGETSERQMMVYFPEHKLLYGSDAFQKDQEGNYFYPQTVSEVAAAVIREKLSVETFFMMHVGPTPWKEAVEALQKAGS